MLKRTSFEHLNSILEKNPEWKILDIGCGYRAHPKASTISDVQDFSKFYKDKKFIKIKDKILPFKDKEFDFVITSHVLEHVKDVDFLIKELERVATKGYIELPTILEDNLVFENKKDHLWQLTFDDVNNKIIISNKIQYFEPILTVSTIKKLNNYFRESLVLELVPVGFHFRY